MHLKLVITIAIFAACLLSSGCKKETDDTCATDPSQCPPPDLCAETDNCYDGILNDFLRSWKPVGGDFEGQSVLNCINDICTDIRFTFFKDSTYLIETVKVYPDSTSTQPLVIQGQETGTYRVGDCECRQTGNWWDGHKVNKDGKIYFSPAGGAAYKVNFQHFINGMFLTFSSRDPTFELYVH